LAHQLVKNVREVISDLRKVPVIRAAVPFAAGIPAAAFIRTGTANCLPAELVSMPVGRLILLCLLILLILAFLVFLFHPGMPRSKMRSRGLVIRGCLLFTAFFSLGAAHHVASRMYRVSEHVLSGQEGFLEGIVVDGAVMKNNRWRVRVAAVAFMNDAVCTTLCEYVQLYLPGGPGIPGLKPGEYVVVRGRLDRIRNNGNPGAFDYAGYMDRRRTRYQVFVRDEIHCSFPVEKKTVPGYGPARLRHRIIGGWDRDDPDVAVLSALTLGYKSLLDQETKVAFSDAGAMHLLAVSGLHVGMIWWILEKLIRVPPGRPAWRRLKLIVIVAILWGYAAVTGFSDSVTRSVTMFSLLTLSRSIHRNSNIYQTLLLSALLLLLFKPSRIMEPGFQLSYIAVTGIVAIQPRLEQLYSTAHRFARRILDLISVSIAAQVSTLPLVLTYFHQFPAWFLLTNLAAIPLVSIILALFVLFIPVLVFFPEWKLFSEILLWVAGLLNRTVSGIASLPGSVVRDVYPDQVLMMLVAGILVSLCMLMYYRRTLFMMMALLLCAATIVLPVYRLRQLSGESSLTVFNLHNATMVSSLQGPLRETYLFPSDTLQDPYLMTYVQSLSGSPPGLRSHHVFSPGCELSEVASMYMIASGLWAIRPGTLNVLIAGDCDREVLQQALRSYHWHLVICRRGIPLYGLEEALEAFGGKLAGDGTLMPYERRLLREMFPSIWLTVSAGAFVLDNDVWHPWATTDKGLPEPGTAQRLDPLSLPIGASHPSATGGLPFTD
jgi:competence protein ComEC